ncbi:hypothetical protein GLOTRDRAFT_79414 [Gloeophyllum trabeum ATCC 11539]|uniref:Sulfate anion transporter n=1 Tax=Gloeophyllum trabeum (strain ATCC 11539 / FP-39264 / Madison 617) TaxID=670483 RepID=S7RKU5_GLOTA|nr:uncharacterized protein GLOTRDRAFT_79414 [Gloeophyllum trabeum ATCC 11539]EPQ53294.1 hypothetical protein GLOTRDRAFT_79414 [Gloeophyllum trabeum ATCC 11539]
MDKIAEEQEPQPGPGPGQREDSPSRFATESSPLLLQRDPTPSHHAANGSARPAKWTQAATLRAPRLARDAVRALPAVLLGTLLNILDGVSYGMIIFPAAGVFADLGPMGVSMFFVSAVVAQLTYSCGGSGFAGANGSMMIEVVPFFHILATSIARELGEDHPREIIATTLVAFAFSSVLTGLTFFLLGALRLGILIGFFPRHILVGCIGGVGVFLIITGLTVSTRMPDDDFALSLPVLRHLFLNAALWAPALALAVLLRVVTHRFRHQLVFPLYFIAIPAVFYVVVAAARLDLPALRRSGWLFDVAASREPWWQFYTYYDPRATRLAPLVSTLPTQLALLFFNILHPPLNVPALAVSLDIDVDTNKELVGHGYSNLLAGFLGTVPNYLVYVNTLLFYRVRGDTRVSGFLLAGATVVLLLIGTGPLAYIPVMVVSALIFVLGIDLVKEAVWDTRHRVSRFEYITIISIMVVMTVWDFVMGVLFGIVVSCFFFVLQNSQRRSIRSLHTGETVMSTVRRPSAHRAYIREVSKQTTILRMQGFLFFGTIAHVEETIRDLVDGPRWARTPVRFLVLDFTLVAGVDMSAAEAFMRIQRLLHAKQIVLVLCGFTTESPVGRSLRNVGLLQESGVEAFSTLNDALEWMENAYLRTWFSAQKEERDPIALPGRQDVDLGFHHSLSSSPRRSQLADIGNRTIARDHSIDSRPTQQEPYDTLVKAFASYGDVDKELFSKLVPYLERLPVPEGHVLFQQGDEPDGLYIIEAGILRATYKFTDFTLIEESMVPGTLAGELSALSGETRNATVVVERQAILWRLSTENLQRLEVENPHLASSFTKLVLKAAKTDYDILLASLAARQ